MDKIIFTKRFGTTKILPFLKKPMVLAPRLSLDGDVELGLEGREGFEGGSSNIIKILYSLDWFKGKFTGKPWFLPSNIGFS